MAKLLTSRDRFNDVITSWQTLTPLRKDAETYVLLGYALAIKVQRWADGLASLEQARA